MGDIPRAPSATLVKCHHDILGQDFRFSKFGVGGLDTELKELSRRVLLPHMLPQVGLAYSLEFFEKSKAYTSGAGPDVNMVFLSPPHTFFFSYGDGY